MAVGIHIVSVTLKDVSPAGNLIDRTRATIGQVMTASKEHRVIPDPTVPNSAGSPSVSAYLTLEAAGNYVLHYMDQYTIVTYDEAAAAAMAPIMTVVSVGATATLAAMKGSALAATTRKVTLVPQAVGITFAIGAATGDSTPLSTPVEIDGTALSLAALQCYAAAATKMSIIEEA